MDHGVPRPEGRDARGAFGAGQGSGKASEARQGQGKAEEEGEGQTEEGEEEREEEGQEGGEESREESQEGGEEKETALTVLGGRYAAGPTAPRVFDPRRSVVYAAVSQGDRAWHARTGRLPGINA